MRNQGSSENSLKAEMMKQQTIRTYCSAGGQLQKVVKTTAHELMKKGTLSMANSREQKVRHLARAASQQSTSTTLFCGAKGRMAQDKDMRFAKVDEKSMSTSLEPCEIKAAEVKALTFDD